MEPKKLYTIRWTQAYPQVSDQDLVNILRNFYDELVEQMIDEGDLTEAQHEIERIMKL
jgi:regulator of sigma D